jgi:hypothetical protein
VCIFAGPQVVKTVNFAKIHLLNYVLALLHFRFLFIYSIKEKIFFNKDLSCQLYPVLRLSLEAPIFFSCQQLERPEADTTWDNAHVISQPENKRLSLLKLLHIKVNISDFVSFMSRRTLVDPCLDPYRKDIGEAHTFLLSSYSAPPPLSAFIGR